MKNFKYMKLLLLSLAFIYSNFGCSDNEYSFDYKAEPKTEIGIKLVEGTNLFAQIYTDSTYTVTDGVKATEIHYLSQKGLAMKIFIFEVDLKNPDILIEASSPKDKPIYAMQQMTKQATFVDKEGHKVWAGVNADFYNMSTGEPRGVFYKKGTAIRTKFDSGTRSFFAIMKDKKALVATSAEYTDIAATGDIVEAVGGSVTLVSQGNVVKHADTTIEPRTCIGISKDGTKIYILAVDGRNFWYSNGMGFEELGECMQAMGAYNSINLDGGGSTTFFVRSTSGFEDNRFQIRNWPTDNGGQERSVANGLLIISKK
ncbi:phosphodiester glycosidase family protein [Dysgonomonas sp. BGC7]|nr:phosphodiester glycosidase family protein [Dysgonomonas sp. BGC7]